MRKSQVRVEDAGLEQQRLTPPRGSEGRGGEEKGSRSFHKEGYLMRAVTFDGRMQPGCEIPQGRSEVSTVRNLSLLPFFHLLTMSPINWTQPEARRQESPFV